jgi:hypothetical protein
MPPLLGLEQIGQPLRIDTRHRDVRTDAINDQRAQQEQQATLEIAELSRCLPSVAAD